MKKMILMMVFVGLILGCDGGDVKHEGGAEIPILVVDNELMVGEVNHSLPPEWLKDSWKKVEVKESGGKVKDVFVDGVNITQFGNAHHIYDAKVSPSGKYLFVWHMDYTPRKLSIYDLDLGVLKKMIEPGAGGSMKWAAGDLIFHKFGAGTNTAFWSVFNVEGEVLWAGATSGAELDESGLYVVIYPTLAADDGYVMIADVRDGRVLAKTRPVEIDLVQQYAWLNGETVRVWYRTIENEVKSVDMVLDFENAEAWEVYRREGY
ncbi:hypothetical protein JD969_10050 [Planctomycetota bacterium]|nr:hypothetical protein JD969_10050 [Planctomycetota bacterium]